MTTTTEPTNALANREFTDQQIRTRLDAAAKPGFGLAKATPDQLNMVYLLAKHYDVDPAIDLTLFQNQPFFTIDGRVRLMRRHPQYLGYRTRPLTRDEKDAWGYKPEEVVVECTIKTRTWGDIVARGKVTPDEFGRQPVARSHPQEMAEKRAIARASRMAFGQDVPDEDELGHLILEQRDPPPEVIARNAQQYDKAFGRDDDGSAFAELPVGKGAPTYDRAPAPEPQPEPEAPAAPKQSTKDMRRSETLELYGALLTQARQAGVIAEADMPKWSLRENMPEVQIISKGRELRALLNQATMTRATAAGPQPPDPSPEPEPQPEPSTQPEKPEMITTKSPLGQKLATLVQEAAAAEVDFSDAQIEFPAAKETVIRLIERLEDRIAQKAGGLEELPSF